ncbi:WXG100 family type VII secretion target [Streptomyces sp. Da 82-17]|uniref:WXG100 family type VII secretion target n=1 Tax=Streptomyces sp. Da 82-17 TaxID=3377116 RepID=UPI0038D38A4B
MSSNDDVRPISAPNDGPDPRIEAPVADNQGFDPNIVAPIAEGDSLVDRPSLTNPGPTVPDPGFTMPSEPHRMPAPDGNLDIRNPGPTVADPGFTYGGLAPMTAADAAGGAPPVHGLERPDRGGSLPDPSPTAPDPGFAYGGLAPMTAADAGGGAQGHALETPDHPVDVRDLDPAPGYRDGMAPGGSSAGGVQTMSGGGPGGAVGSNAFSGVDDPGALNRAGQASTEIGGTVKTAGMVGDDERLWGGVGALSGDLWGGELGVALSSAMESWDAQATKLRKSCEAIGQQCTATANNYTTTESANESEMNSVRNSLADFN